MQYVITAVILVSIVWLVLKKNGRYDPQPTDAPQSPKTGWRYAGIIFVLLAWQLTAYYKQSPMIPPIQKIIAAWAGMVQSGELYDNASESLITISIGISIAAVGGFVLGILFYTSDKIRQAVEPVLDFIRPIAALSLFPLFIILLGLGRPSKVVVILWTAWPAILLNTSLGLNRVDKDVKDAGMMDGATHARLMHSILIPLAMPVILTGLRIGISGGWISLVAAEMLGSNSGLGWAVMSYSQTFRFAEMYATILTI